MAESRGGRRRRSPHPFLRLAEALASPGSYGLVVVLTVASYALAVTLTSARASSLTLAVQMLAVWFAFHTSQARRRTMLMVNVMVSAAVVVGVTSLFVTSPDDSPTLVLLAGCVAYFFAPFAIVRYIGSRDRIDLESVLGAVAAYLMLGMFFAFAYSLIGAVQSTPFFGAGGDGDMADTLFFSFITLTTVGYGNLVPASNPGQSLAALEAVSGQLFLVTAVAKIIGAWQPMSGAVSPVEEPGPAASLPDSSER